jgi:hypothetical protein
MSPRRAAQRRSLDSVGEYQIMPNPHQSFRPFLLALGSTIAVLGLAPWIPNSEVAAGAAIVAIFVGFPVTILLYRDGLRTRAADSPGGRANLVLSLPIRALGGIMLLTGLAAIGWLAYNLFIDRQAQFTGVRSLGQLVLPFLLIAYGYRWMRHPLEVPPSERTLSNQPLQPTSGGRIEVE